MRIIREVPIGRIVVRKNDLINLANVFEEEAKNCTEKPTLLFKIQCMNNISFSDCTSGIFRNENKIDTHALTDVKMELSSYKDEKYITLSLGLSNYLPNYIEIVGDNENWVQGVAGIFEDVLKSIEKQDNWFLRRKKLIVNLSAIPLGFIPGEYLKLMIGIFVNDLHYSTTNPIYSFMEILLSVRGDIWFVPLTNILLYWSIGSVLSTRLYSNATKLWKDVEFDTGPEHAKKEKNLRRNIAKFFALVVLPIILSLLFELFKY